MDESKTDYYVRDVSQTENLLKENSTFYSEISDKRSDNTYYDKKTDYNYVIKQFDELISELSSVRTMKDKNASLNKNLAFGDDNFPLSIQNTKTESAEYCKNDSLINKKEVFYNQSSRMVPAPPKDKVDKVESMDLESRTYISKDKCPYLPDITLLEKKFNEKTFSDGKGNVQWINSHLWNLKKERQVSPSPNSQINRKIPTENFKDFFKGNKYSSPELVMTNMPQIANTFDGSYLLKQRQRNVSYYNTSVNYDRKALSHVRNPIQENHLFHQKLEFAKNKTGVNSSIPRSPKASRSSISKYISPNNCFLVKLYIETKVLHLGPFMFEIFPKMTLRLLKLKVEQEHGIISSLQRWILGKHFAVDNDKSLADYNVLPGSSIIVYVDAEQTISNNKAKNKVSSVINTTKFKDAQIAIKKQKSGSYDNLNIIDKESVELIRKDSLDSKLDESCSKINVSENKNFDVSLKEQMTKIFTSKTQNEKEDTGSKKQTKIIVHDKQDLSISNDSKNSFSNTQNIDILTKHTPDLAKKAYSTEKELSSSSHVKPLFKKIRKKSQPIYLNQSLNISSGNKETNLIQITDHINNKSEKLNFGEIKDSVGRMECDNYKKNDIKCNSEKKHAEKACENMKDAFIGSENRSQDINVADASNESLTGNSENTLLDVFNLEKVKTADSFCMNLEEKSKGKQSITSLIRKLSLTRKTKSTEDDYSQMEASNKVQNIEINNENNSKLLSQSTNQSIPSDIHIEILPCDLQTISSENECITQQIGENLPTDTTDHDAESTKNFELLLEIENMDLVQNTFHFSCPVCFEEFESGQGVILHDCLHAFCRDCLINAVCYADGALVKCPYRDEFYTCQSHLQQREIKALVSEDMYEKYLQRSITTAEGLAERSFHCKTPDCKGWCIYDNAINVFHCPVCSHYNCLNCQAIHEGLNCHQYQDKLKLQQKVDKESEKTLSLLNEMIKSGKALRCPKCDLILLKKWGCDWLKCSICKTEICWITKGPRWGPGGQGDTSGGCKCGVNGVKCHPSCTYCH